MITVGAFEAKTHLSSLLEPVARGEEVMITRHGRPIARLVPAGVNDLEATIEEMKRAAKGRRLGISTHRGTRAWTLMTSPLLDVSRNQVLML